MDEACAHGAVDAFGKDVQARCEGRVFLGPNVVRHRHSTVQIMRFRETAQRHFLVRVLDDTVGNHLGHGGLSLAHP